MLEPIYNALYVILYTVSEGNIGVVMTPGEAHDITAFPALMQEVDCGRKQLLGDKGYDRRHAPGNCQRRRRNPYSNQTGPKIQQTVGKAIYGVRNRVEWFFNCPKDSRCIATRYDERIESFAAFVILARIRFWISLSTRPRWLAED